MANTFDEQAKERFQRSLAFMRKAEALLQDDLIYRSALADGVSAIKNMLQGYLLYKVAHLPTSAVTQRWQEIAISNRMPELIATCGEAGLDLRGLAVEIKRLNTERNNRAHDDPQQTIDSKQAQRAVELARELQRRIKVANEGKTDTRSISQRAAGVVDVVRGAVSGQLKLPAATATPTSATGRAQTVGETSPARGASTVAIATMTAAENAELPAPSTPESRSKASGPGDPTPVRVTGDSQRPEQALDAMRALDDTPDTTDDGDSSELPAISRRGARRRRGLFWRSLAMAAVLLVGVAAGVGVAIPLAHGNTPDWLGFTRSWFAATNAPTATITPTATTPAVSGATTVGTLAISAPACANGVVSFALTNQGAESAHWAVGSPDASGATFGTNATTATEPSLTGTLSAGQRATVYVAGPAAGAPFHVSVVASGGAVQLLVLAC